MTDMLPWPDGVDRCIDDSIPWIVIDNHTGRSIMVEYRRCAERDAELVEIEPGESFAFMLADEGCCGGSVVFAGFSSNR